MILALSLLQTTGALFSPALAGTVGPNSGAAGMPLATPAPGVDAEPADAAPAPAVRNGDLTHLVFTARSGLVPALIAPGVNSVVGTSVAKVTVETIEGAGVELSVDGAVMPASHLGERAIDSSAHTARYTYYAVPFKVGPNDVALTALGADGLRGTTLRYRVFGAGKPAAVRATINGRLVADGRTPGTLSIVATDALAHSAQAGSQVIVSVHSGDVRLALTGDEHPSGTSAVKLSLDADGKATVLVLPGATSGNISLTVETGDAKTTASAFVTPFLRRAFVTGLVSGGLGSTPGDEDGDGNLDAGGSRRGRVALYGSGQVFDHFSLTFAYDTASRLAPLTTAGPFVADPNDRPYQTYGDASTQRDDAVSSARLYARVEDGHDAFTYGQFTADLGGGDASATSYHQVLNGSQLQLADSSERVRVTLFNAQNDVAYGRQTFAASGLASLGASLAPNIVIGTDVVTLVALDRRTGAAIAQTILQPNVDYVLDDASGQLRFIQVPLPFDAELNPQIVVITYQYTGSGTQSHTTGGSTTLRLGNAANAPTLRLGYVNDVTGAGNFSIFEQALAGTLHGGAWSLVHASADGLDANGSSLTNGYGQSTHFALTSASHALHLTLGFDDTSAGYQNPFGGFATPGLLDMRVLLAHPLHDGGEIALSYDQQANSGLGSNSTQSDASLGWKQHYGRLAVHTAIDVRRQNTPAISPGLLVPTPAPDGSIPALVPGAIVPAGPAIASSATQATVGLDYRLGEKSTLSLTRIEDIGGAPDSSLTQPAETVAGIDLAVDRSTHAYVRSIWSAAPQIGFAESSAAFTAQSGTQVTTFGIDRDVSPNTTVTTQWALQNTGNATDVYTTNGVRERLVFSKDLKGDAFFQTAQTNGASDAAGEFSVYGLSLAYGGKPFHASAAFQNRVGTSPGFDLQLGAGGALSPDISLLGHLDDAVTGGFQGVDARLGLAWRPDDGAGASLLELERHTGNLTDGVERADTLSFDEAYRLNGRLEIDARFAYKLDGDTYYVAHSMLAGFRVAERIGSRNDLALESQTLLVPGIAGATQTAFAVETGERITDSLRFAVGYNFSGAADPALVAAPTRRGEYVTLTSIVDRVFGWGR
jgi:hypothetical protein